jgi:hypothetical protein
MTALLLLSTAHAQQVSSFSPKGTDCGAAFPIAGTTGAVNAYEAVRNNQSTYSATAFARRALDTRLAHHHGDGEGWNVDLTWDHNQTYGVERVVALHPKASDPSAENCDPKYQTGQRPVDAWSSNFGLTANVGRVSLFYATSITYSGTVAGDQFIRVGQSIGITPFYAAGFAGLVPLWDLSTVGPTSYDLGAAGIALDWIIGANADLELLDLTAGYAGSKGGYLRLAEHTVGLHASATIGPKASYGYIAIGGLDRLNLAQFDGALEAVGLTTFDYLDRPYVEASFGTPPQAANLPPALETAEPVQRWRTTRLAQQNLGGVLDVDAEYRLAPHPMVQRAIVGLHTPMFYRPRLGWEDDTERLGLLVQGGVVGLPPHYALGDAGGFTPSARVSAGILSSEARMLLTLMVNDPEQLNLFPFGSTMIGWSLNVDGTF